MAQTFAGWFALLTGAIVLVSAVWQIREKELSSNEARGQFVFAAGMIIAGIGVGFIAPPLGPRVAIGGIVTLAIGLLLQERSHPRH